MQKTVNGVVTKYILHGKNITHLIRGNDELHFFYDASGSPAMVEWNNGTTVAKYAYVKNLQGDIIAIIDDAGAEVVKYTYDAWGTPVNTVGTLASTLGILQPLRYRGYVFDEETGIYYLRNRYYCPYKQRFFNADCCILNNLWSYCLNNPIIIVDSSGKKSCLFNDDSGVSIQSSIESTISLSEGCYYSFTLNSPFVLRTKNNEAILRMPAGTKLTGKYSPDKKDRFEVYYKEYFEGSAFVEYIPNLYANILEASDYQYYYGCDDLYEGKSRSVFTCHLQETLGIEADGYYGSQTKEAVISFQRTFNERNEYYQLEVDGIAGDKTKYELYNNVQ